MTGHYQQRANSIVLCYEEAKSKGFKIFALQHGGWCAGTAGGEGYKKYGAATNCFGGKGGPMSNDVYRIIEGIVSIVLFNNHNGNTRY